jgi:hypothetical protein
VQHVKNFVRAEFENLRFYRTPDIFLSIYGRRGMRFCHDEMKSKFYTGGVV